jgi:uncharacterized protein
MLPLGLAASLLIGVCMGFFGGGGSILTVPLLVYGFGLAPKEAIATSLVVVGVASFFAALSHWRAGHVDVRTSLLFGGAGMAGAYAGGRIAARLDGALLLFLFVALMTGSAIAMWRSRAPAHAAPPGRNAVRLALQGLAVGLVTGLVGAGGGFLIVPALALWARVPMRTAIGTSLFIIVLNTAAGLAGYVAHVSVSPLLASSVSTAAILGSLLGAELVRRADPVSLRKGFAGFVLATAALISTREAGLWVDAARGGIPSSAPEIAFTLFVLITGIAAGRVSRRAGSHPFDERMFEKGAGI